MKALALAIVGLLAIDASAAPRKVLVLKLDGTASPADRAKLEGQLLRLAKQGDVLVTMGDTTFVETASAVGCDPAVPACSETVRKTLAVDEIVYGTATTTPAGQVELAIHRSQDGAPPKDGTATVAPSDPPDKADDALGPLFGIPTKAVVVPPPPPPPPAEDHRQRNYGIAAAVGGGVALLIGLTLWSQESSIQDSINSHPTSTTKDLLDLKSVEDQASSSGWWGNVLVVAGLGLGGYGAYILYKDHSAHKVVVAPAAMDHGAGVSLTILGGL